MGGLDTCHGNEKIERDVQVLRGQKNEGKEECESTMIKGNQCATTIHLSRIQEQGLYTTRVQMLCLKPPSQQTQILVLASLTSPLSTSLIGSLTPPLPSHRFSTLFHS